MQSLHERRWITKYGISAPTEMPYFFLRHRAESVLHAREGVDLQKVFYANPTLIMKKKDYSYVGLTLQVEVRVPVLLKVKAYTRVRFGKTEKVSSYYRHIGVRK